MEQHAFALSYPNRLAVAQHVAVDGEDLVTDLVAVRHAPRERGLHGALARRLQPQIDVGWAQEILGHVAALAERRLELLERKKHLAVEASGLMPRLDVNGADLAAVLAKRQVTARYHM